MMEDRADPGIEILKLLWLREQHRGGSLPEFHELVTAVRLPRDLVKEVCDGLAEDGYVANNNIVQEQLRATYFITDLGKWYLYQREL